MKSINSPFDSLARHRAYTYYLSYVYFAFVSSATDIQSVSVDSTFLYVLLAP